MTLKEFVITHVSANDYYAKRFPKWNSRVRPLVSCPFHDDGAKPNLSVGLRNGGAHCFSAQCTKKRFGNIVHFESELQGIKEGLAARRLYREFYRKVIPSKLLVQLRENLQTNTHYLLKIKKEMGLTYKWVKKFQLGLDIESHRITIPVYDQFNQCINIRYYRLPSERTKSDDAKLYNQKGYGGCDLFPSVSFDDVPNGAPIFIMGAEKEAMLARSDGLYAFSSTAGEGSWSTDWESALEDHDVFVVYDTDKSGREATDRILNQLKSRRDRVYPVLLPFRKRRPDRKDYADWRLKEKKDSADLLKLIKSNVQKRSSTGRNGVRNSMDDPMDHHANRDSVGKIVVPKSAELESETMYDIASIGSRSDLLNKKIRTQGIVAAKSPTTFSIPWRFKVKVKNRPALIYELPLGRELLRFIRSNDTSILQCLQSIMGTSSMTVEPLSYITATEVEVIPTVTLEEDTPYVIQRCYYFGERIDANVPYYLEIIPTSEIRSQETIGIITKISPLSKSIERFDFSASNLADLSMFQPDEESVWDKLISVANAVAEDHTRVYNRTDWTLVALLTWTSPIGWRFPNEPELQRGWLNTLALGDTETGKSKLTKALKGLFNCGVFVNGENCTFTGLVGGAIKMGSGQLMLRWGRIPLNDRQLVILEELSGLSVEEISNMSEVRSSGIARLDKGGINSETNSRTRLLCLSNARSQRRSVSQNLYGVLAVQELIGHGEDIARFDFITTLTDREVSVDIINTDHFATIAKRKQPINKISSDQYQKLINFIWALQPDQIEFDYNAYEECLTQTKRLSGIYHPAIPIFKGGSGRYKLGRIAASIACLQFSWDDDERKVRITIEHVRAAAQLLETIYGKHSFGYLEWSRQMYEREQVQDGAFLRKTFIQKIPKKILSKVLEALLHSTKFNRDELCAMASTSFLHADQLIGAMLLCHVISKLEANVWAITPAGKEFLIKFKKRFQ